MKLILNSDDFGLTFGSCQAITDCYLRGNTTSTSIIVNGSAYTYALQLLRTKLKKISLGLHLNLTHGPAFSPKLANSLGNYRFNFFNYLIHTINPNKYLLEAIREDIRLQFETSIKRDRLRFDHVDGHDHIHMIPPIFEIVCQECQKYNIPYLRITQEPYYLAPNLSQTLTPLKNKNILKLILLNQCAQVNKKTLGHYKLKTTQAYYGLLHSNNMNYSTLTAAMKDAMKKQMNTIEIAFHPAYPNPARDIIYHDKLVTWFSNLPQREEEVLLLTSPQLRQFIQQENLVLTGFKGL